MKKEMVIKKVNDYPDVLSVRDVMAILHIGRASVYRMIQERTLPARMLAGSYKIPKSGVMAMIRSIHQFGREMCYNESNNNSDALPKEMECKQ